MPAIALKNIRESAVSAVLPTGDPHRSRARPGFPDTFRCAPGTHSGLRPHSPRGFRRDEIWFIDKKDGISDLHSLKSFESKVSIDTALPKTYLEGRFGALPLCREI